MKILAIETSCDETAASIIEARGELNPPSSGHYFKIISNIVSSQIKIHKKYGGVVPYLAAREHLKNLPIVFRQAIGNIAPEKFKKEIDLIAVTNGPGLIPCLLLGTNFAKTLAFSLEKPVIPINHLEAHIYSSCISESKRRTTQNERRTAQTKHSKFSVSPRLVSVSPRRLEFPLIAGVFSGGHTLIVLMKDHLKYEIIGETLDDAAGESFDKVAKMLGLKYPGGPAISAEVEKFQITNNKLQITNYKNFDIKLPRPMINSQNFDFSFSGLKTATLYLIRDLKEKEADIKKLTPQIAYEFQEAVVEVLTTKLIKAAQKYRVKTILVGGGVIANKRLREVLQNEADKNNFLIYFPPRDLIGDNAAMIGIAAYFRYKLKGGQKWKAIKADANLKLVSRK